MFCVVVSIVLPSSRKCKSLAARLRALRSSGVVEALATAVSTLHTLATSAVVASRAAGAADDSDASSDEDDEADDFEPAPASRAAVLQWAAVEAQMHTALMAAPLR